MVNGRDDAHGGIDEARRRELVVLARRPRARTSAFSLERPSDWRPNQVRNPNGILDSHFTDSTAWELIAERLEAGEEVEVIELRIPAKASGYVMRIQLAADVPELYIKLQLGAGKIFGRSFHYSKHD